MRLQGDDYSKRLESYAYDTIFLMSKCMGMPKEFNYRMHDITTDSELNEEEVAKRLRDLIGTAIIETFEKSEPSLDGAKIVIGDPEECGCCNCKECEHLLECIDKVKWPEYSKDGKKTKFLFKTYVGPAAGGREYMRLPNDESGERLKSFSDETVHLISATMFLPKAFYDGCYDVLANDKLDEAELVKRLKVILVISICVVFDKDVATDIPFSEDFYLVPGVPDECECCNCRDCKYLISCVKNADWPEDFNDGKKFNFMWDDE